MPQSALLKALEGIPERQRSASLSCVLHLGPSFLPGSSTQTPSLSVLERPEWALCSVGRCRRLRAVIPSWMMLPVHPTSDFWDKRRGRTGRGSTAETEPASPSSRGSFQPQLWEGITLLDCRNSLLPNTCRFRGHVFSLFIL